MDSLNVVIRKLRAKFINDEVNFSKVEREFSISRRTIYNILDRKTQPRIETLNILCKSVGLELEIKIKEVLQE